MTPLELAAYLKTISRKEREKAHAAKDLSFSHGLHAGYAAAYGLCADWIEESLPARAAAQSGHGERARTPGELNSVINQ